VYAEIVPEPPRVLVLVRVSFAPVDEPGFPPPDEPELFPELPLPDEGALLPELLLPEELELLPEEPKLSSQYSKNQIATDRNTANPFLFTIAKSRYLKAEVVFFFLASVSAFRLRQVAFIVFPFPVLLK